jgi:copper chaperone CopZ
MMTEPTHPTTETALHVVGMHCSSCEHHIESALLALPGVARVEVERRADRVRVVHATSTSTRELMRVIEDQGYPTTLAASPGATAR